jgi:hypothetical protein
MERSHNNLNSEHIQILERNGNTAICWADIFISTNFDNNSLQNIRNCHFGGFITIGNLANNLSTSKWPIISKRKCGLYNSNFFGICAIENSVLISNCECICNVYVNSDSAIIQSCINYDYGDCKKEGISCGECTVGSEIGSVGGGGRTMCLFSRNCNGYLDICSTVLDCRKTGKHDHEHMEEWQQLYKKRQTVIEYGCFINNCANIVNCFIGRGSCVQGSSVEYSVLKSSHKDLGSYSGCVVTNGCKISYCVLHCEYHNDSATNKWVSGCVTVSDHCIVTNSILFAHSSVSSGALVSNSVIASDSSVSRGECAHSVVGPFVGFHHASLLMAALWLSGRGNLAYGAAFGGNHTGRMNDQECLLGEGVFLGLNTSAKFPLNLASSPYSIVAGGCKCLQPQVISLPFSLITESADNQSTLLLPAWVLYANPYMLERSTQKFGKRRKSQVIATDFPVFRPRIVSLMQQARDLLKEALSAEHSGIIQHGSCVVQAADAAVGVTAYNLYIRKYAIQVQFCYC